MRQSTWEPLFSQVLDVEAYKKSLYIAAGCEMKIKQIDKLEGALAAYMYGKNCSEAFLLEGYFKGFDKVWQSRLFLVSSKAPVLAVTDYRADWSEEHGLYIVREHERNVVVKKEVINEGCFGVFAHFNFGYGYEEEEEADDEQLKASPVPSDSSEDILDQQLEAYSEQLDDVSDAQLEQEEIFLAPIEGPSEGLQEQEEDVHIPSYEEQFWVQLYNSPETQANPAGLEDESLYTEPSGSYRALSFDCLPQDFISTTTPATSLWAVASNNILHHNHGFIDRTLEKQSSSPFSRQSIITAQALKTLTPFRYDGPGNLLNEHSGTALQNAVTGYAHKSFLPVGTIMNEQHDPEDPHEIHTPGMQHWSRLTLPVAYNTTPYYYDHNDYDHTPVPLPYGRSKHQSEKQYSKLRHMELCYEDENETQEALKATSVQDVEQKQDIEQDDEEALSALSVHGDDEDLATESTTSSEARSTGKTSPELAPVNTAKQHFSAAEESAIIMSLEEHADTLTAVSVSDTETMQVDDVDDGGPTQAWLQHEDPPDPPESDTPAVMQEAFDGGIDWKAVRWFTTGMVVGAVMLAAWNRLP